MWVCVHVEGNLVTVQDQEAKLRLVADTAKEVMGKTSSVSRPIVRFGSKG